MSLPIYVLTFFLAAAGIILILRVFVRKDYLTQGRLRPSRVLLEYVMVFIWVAFGWVNMPPYWPAIRVGPIQQGLGWFGVVVGLLLFGTAMLKLGVGRSHGMPRGGIHQAGLYRWTRNPQIVGFGIFMIGFTVLWPTWQTLGTLALLGILAHTMVLTEEEFLGHKAGEDYRDYRQRVPRYLGRAGPARTE